MRRKSQQQLLIENLDNIIAECAEAKARAQESDYEGVMECLGVIDDEKIEGEKIAEKKVERLRVKVATGL